jgi:hypothetical protein
MSRAEWVFELARRNAATEPRPLSSLDAVPTEGLELVVTSRVWRVAVEQDVESRRVASRRGMSPRANGPGVWLHGV